MNRMEIIQSMGFSMPMFAALICFVMLLMYYRRSNKYTQRRLTRIMISAYAAAVFCLMGIILYIVNYQIYIWYNPVFFMAMALNQVLLYNFMFILTGTGKTERLSPMHYVMPLVYTVVLSVWSLLTPYEVQYFIVESRGDFAEGYTLYSMAHLAAVPTFIAYNLFYPLLALRRIKAYKREVVNYSADEQRNSTRWLYRIILLIWLSLPLTIATLFLHKSVIFSSSWTVLGVLPMVFQYTIICYNLMAGNYVIIRPNEMEEPGNQREGHKKDIPLSKAQFEKYMKEHRPCLDPKLKITDLCTSLGTNRTYLSAFINSEYNMNFNRYMNRRRLEELDRLRTDPATSGETGMELVLKAGFSSYRSYVRVKDQEDRNKLLKSI